MRSRTIRRIPTNSGSMHFINRWHVEQYGYLLRKLRDMKEGERSVLDNSMILFGSALSDGNSHNPHAAAGACGTSRRPARIRTAPGVLRGFAGGESVCVHARRFWYACRALRRQHWPLPGVLA